LECSREVFPIAWGGGAAKSLTRHLSSIPKWGEKRKKKKVGAERRKNQN